jgi:NADPH:quinone reductase-like Zn-dependent oxidoreductase
MSDRVSSMFPTGTEALPVPRANRIMRTMMRAAAYERFGDPDVVTIMDLPRPEPGPGEVRVAVHAVALNHLDLWVRRGLPTLALPLPHIGGSDFSGVVDSVGAGVSDWKQGDEVVVNPSLPCLECATCRRGDHPLCGQYKIIGEHVPGGLAEYAVVPAHRLHTKPQRLTFVQAAAVPLSFQTAWRALITRARLRMGETVLVLGASGGTASAAVQIAVQAGARVYAVTSTGEGVALARRLGAHFVVDRLERPWSKAVYQATDKRGVDVVVENVGAATWHDSIRVVAPAGRIVTYGATAGATPETDIRYLFWKQIDILGSTMATDAEFDSVMGQIEAGALSPVVGTVLPLEQTRQAHELLEHGEVLGKVVLEVR